MSSFCKFYKEVKQVSYDSGQTWENLDEYRKGDLYETGSVDCGGGITQYRWVNVSGQYTCVGTTKYQKTKKQQSTDGGNTWSDVSPIEYGIGAVIEYNSSDCGSYNSQYLTFVATESGTFKFNGTVISNSIQYSLDSGTTWSTLANFTNSPTVQSGKKIMWKGELTTTDSSGHTYNGIGDFSSTNSFTVEGNVMSLLYGDNFVNQTSLNEERKLMWLFKNCTYLTSAENLILPATTLAEDCYYGMFDGCTSLTTAPQLPATTLADSCYNRMFEGCRSLTTAPVLSATTLEVGCYIYMFSGCTSLTTAPSTLPATTLTQSCYLGMFYGCTSLTTAPQLPATTLADSCYWGMFRDCTSLTTAPQLPATTLAYSCYAGMFWGCTSLTTAPVLLATTLANYCYSNMFNGCTSLTTAPSTLPATTLAYYCYNSMFRDCTSLTTAPQLPATTLTQSCYNGMFYGCTRLNYIKCLATDISAYWCTTDWVNGVASSGTFVKASSMSSWTSGSNGIPNNWSIQNA